MGTNNKRAMALTITIVLIALALAALRANAAPDIPHDAYDNCQEEVDPTVWLDLGCNTQGSHAIVYTCDDDGGTQHIWYNEVACGQPQCDLGFTAPDGCVLCHELSTYGQRFFLPFNINQQGIIGDPIIIP